MNFSVRQKSLFLSCLISCFLLLNYVNCGGVSIGFEAATLSSLESKPTFLPPPSEIKNEMRLVVFVDFSNSMVNGVCADDVGGPPEAPPGQPVCDRTAAADVSAKRLKVIEDWLRDLLAKLDSDQESRLKVMIIPFSGGYVEDKRMQLGLDSRMQFLPADQALSYVRDLQTQQADQVDFLFNGTGREDEVLVMGTSVPVSRLNLLRTEVSREFDALKREQKLNAADVQVVFISDGFPKPSGNDVKELFNRIWSKKKYALGPGLGLAGFEQCVPQCANFVAQITNPSTNTEWPSLNSCSETQATLGCSHECLCALYAYKEASTGGSWGRRDRPDDLLADMSSNWGPFELNRPMVILREIGKLKQIFKSNSEANWGFHFFFIKDNTSIESVDPNQNWIRMARSYFKKATLHDVITSNQFDRNFFPATSSSSAFQLKSLIALNFNARVDKFGSLSVDSDGDGLYDYEDPAPNRARGNGFCLDSITKDFGCMTQGCDPQVDIDGDGLNECEEKTLGTDNYDFDTDDDQIPDGLEVVYGLNPRLNSRSNNANPNVDSLSDFEHFRRGLSPYVNPALVEMKNQVQMDLRFYDYKAFEQETRQVYMAGYVAQLLNLPAIPAAEATGSLKLYRSATKNPETEVKPVLVGGDHGPNRNRFGLLGYVESLTNPGHGYWIFHERQIVPQAGDQQIEIDFDHFKILDVKDPRGDER